ncbi:hypothetical protein FB45DRAFT_935038, partial [Roridomyces roridus]
MDYPPRSPVRAAPPTQVQHAASSGGKVFGRPGARLRTSVVRVVRRKCAKASATQESTLNHYDHLAPTPYLLESDAASTPLLRQKRSSPVLPMGYILPPRITETESLRGPFSSSSSRLRRTQSGFFRPPKARRWRRTRKFQSFLVRILNAIYIFPVPPSVFVTQ